MNQTTERVLNVGNDHVFIDPKGGRVQMIDRFVLPGTPASKVYVVANTLDKTDRHEAGTVISMEFGLDSLVRLG